MFHISNKTFKTLSKIQKALLAIMAVAVILMCISMVFKAKSFTEFNSKITVYNLAFSYLLFALAMINGFIYANKGLGKRNTWIIFYIVLAIELLLSPLLSVMGSTVPSEVLPVIPATLARLVITGILGLCIEAKYRDKDARGTV